MCICRCLCLCNITCIYMFHCLHVYFEGMQSLSREFTGAGFSKVFSALSHSGKFVGKGATCFWFACKYLNYRNKQYNQKHNELIKPLEINTENHTNSSNDGVLSITVNCMQPLWNIMDRICCTQKRKQPAQLLSTGSCTLAVHWASQLNLGGVLDAQQLLMATRDIHSDCKVSNDYQMISNGCVDGRNPHPLIWYETETCSLIRNVWQNWDSVYFCPSWGKVGQNQLAPLQRQYPQSQTNKVNWAQHQATPWKMNGWKLQITHLAK